MAAQKGFGIFLALMIGSVILGLLGLPLVTKEVTFEGFDVEVNITHTAVFAVGEYYLTGSIEITNVEYDDIFIHSGSIDIFTDESQTFEIFSYELESQVQLLKSETYDSGSISGTIRLENDDIPDRVYVIFDISYTCGEENFDKSFSDYIDFDINLEDYL